MKISFTIPGPPRTKKNSGRIVQASGRPRMLPSKAFEEWNKQAQIYLMLEKSRCRDSWVGFMPYMDPVNCRALFFVDRWPAGDAVGYYQALADALEDAGIVENDRLISSWDGSRVILDKENPRIEVELRLII
jgi:Holliday junction resolvase RusA-like endonuclease